MKSKNQIQEVTENYNLSVTNENIINIIFECIKEDDSYLLTYLSNELDLNFKFNLNINDIYKINLYNYNDLYNFLDIEIDTYLYDSYNYILIDLLENTFNIDLSDLYYNFTNTKDHLKYIQKLEKEFLNIFKNEYNLNNILDLNDLQNLSDNIYYKDLNHNIQKYLELYNYKIIDNDLILLDKNELLESYNEVIQYKFNYNIVEDTSTAIFEIYISELLYYIENDIINRLNTFNRFNINFKFNIFDYLI